MRQQTFTIHKGDTRTALSVTLMQPNSSGVDTAVDLTGLTVKFKLVDNVGTVVVSETTVGVTVVTAASGTVDYDFSTAAVATAGTYYGYFLVYNGGESDHFPAASRELKIIVADDV